jgi:hypothetical protein
LIDIAIIAERDDFLNANGNGLFAGAVIEFFDEFFERFCLMALFSEEMELTVNAALITCRLQVNMRAQKLL